ncbi:MAG TPA: CAP domain-containing protein [Candidatus Limnocylindrales bacterium]
MLGHFARETSTAIVRLRNVRKVALAVAVALLAVAGTVAPAAAAWNPGFSASDEQLLFALTNQDRASAGLPALVNDTYLHTKAEWRAQDMGDRDYFSHQIPPGNNMVFFYMQQDGYCFKVAGENIGLSTYDDDVATATIETGFMGSPSHRENILGNWNHMGVGAYKAANGNKLYAVLFSMTCAAAPQPTPIPTTKPTAPATPNATARPAAPATPKPTARPTVRATPRPTVTSTPSPTPTPTEAPTATSEPTPTDQPSETPASTPSLEPTAQASPSPDQGATQPTTPAAGAVIGTSGLRVREKAPTGGLLDSLFEALFGGVLRS